MKKVARIAAGAATLGAMVLPFTALALSFEDPSTTIGLGTADLKDTVLNIITWVLGMLGIIAVIMILFGGFQWMLSRGDEEKVAGAKKTISAAIIGVIVILLAWAIINYVLRTASNVTGGGI